MSERSWALKWGKIRELLLIISKKAKSRVVALKTYKQIWIMLIHSDAADFAGFVNSLIMCYFVYFPDSAPKSICSLMFLMFTAPQARLS